MLLDLLFDCLFVANEKVIEEANQLENQIMYPAFAYQNSGTLIVVVDGCQMQSSASMFAALLYVDDIAILAHSTESIHLIKFRSQVNRCLFLVIEYSRVHGSSGATKE